MRELADPLEEVVLRLALLSTTSLVAALGVALKTVADAAEGKLAEATPQQTQHKHQVAIRQICSILTG
jgi:hypothetical protein